MTSLFKTIFSNTIAQVVSKATSVLFSLISTIYFLRLGGSSLYGEYIKAITLIAVGFTVIDFGLNAQAVRRMKQQPKSAQSIFTLTLFSRLFLAIIMIIGLNLFVYLTSKTYSSSFYFIFWLISLSIIFQSIYTSANAWFQYQLTYWISSVISILINFIQALLLILVLLFFHQNLIYLLLVYTFSYFILAILSLSLVKSHLQSPPTLFKILNYLKQTLILGGILILSVLANKLDIIILGNFVTSAQLGQYSFAYRIFEVSLTLPIFITNSLYPLIVGLHPTKRRTLMRQSLKILTVLALVVGLFLFLSAPFILWIKPDLISAVYFLRLLVFFLPLFYLTAPLMWQLIALHQEIKLLYLYGLAVLINGLTNLFLVPIFGAIASIYLTGFTEFIIFGGLLYLTKLTKV